MRFKKLRLKNIRSYLDSEIEFPDGSLLLSGDIGTGKTTALLAIEYALFGLQPGQRGASLLRNTSNFGEVMLELEIDGKEIIIERKLKRSSKSVSNDYSAITLDGQKTECSITELKIKVLELLGYPSEFIKKNNILYRYTVYTPQEEMKQIILEDSETRLNILRHIFGIEKYKKIRENISILLNKVKENSKFLQGEINTLDIDKDSLESTKELLAVLRDRIQEKEIELSKSVSKRKLVESGVLELENKIKEKEKFEREVEKTRILLSTKRESISDIEVESLELSKSISELEGVFKESELDEVLENLSKSKNKLEGINSKYFGIVSKINSLEKDTESNLVKKERIFKIDICPTCLQDVSETHKHNIKNETEKELTEIKRTLENLEREKAEIFSLLENQKTENSSLEKKKMDLSMLKVKTLGLEKSKAKLSSLEKNKEGLKRDLSLLEKHLSDLKDQIAKFSKYNNLFRMKSDELKSALLGEKNSEIALAELKKETELTHKETEKLEVLIKKKEESKNKLSDLLELSDWLSSQFLNLVEFIERNVMIKLRVEFSKLFSKWFQMLAGSSFDVHLDENFTPLVMQNDMEMHYSFLSGGERTSVALAYRLALNQTVNSVFTSIKTGDIVILDEPTDGFSEIQLDKMRDILDELTVKQLIIVSHEQKMESFVDNVLKLSKEDGYSRVDAPENALFNN